MAAKAFVEDCISFEAGSQVTTAELYDAYLEYAEEEGYPQLNRTAFGRALPAALRQTVPEAQPVRRIHLIANCLYNTLLLTPFQKSY